MKLVELKPGLRMNPDHVVAITNEADERTTHIYTVECAESDSYWVVYKPIEVVAALLEGE